MCAHACVRVHMYMWVQVPVEATNIGPPGAVVTCACEQLGMDAGNQTWVLLQDQLML